MRSSLLGIVILPGLARGLLGHPSARGLASCSSFRSLTTMMSTPMEDTPSIDMLKAELQDAQSEIDTLMELKESQQAKIDKLEKIIDKCLETQVESLEELQELEQTEGINCKDFINKYDMSRSNLEWEYMQILAETKAIECTRVILEQAAMSAKPNAKSIAEAVEALTADLFEENQEKEQ